MYVVILYSVWVFSYHFWIFTTYHFSILAPNTPNAPQKWHNTCQPWWCPTTKNTSLTTELISQKKKNLSRKKIDWMDIAGGSTSFSPHPHTLGNWPLVFSGLFATLAHLGCKHIPAPRFQAPIIMGGLGENDTVDGSEIPNNHLLYTKPYETWEKLPSNWCRISSINSTTGIHWCSFPHFVTKTLASRPTTTSPITFRSIPRCWLLIGNQFLGGSWSRWVRHEKRMH